MTSKEALEKLINDYNNVLGNYVMNNYSKEINLIKQDLDRLEKLEKFVDIYKYTNQRFTMMVQAPYTVLPSPTIEQEFLRVEVLENDR